MKEKSSETATDNPIAIRVAQPYTTRPNSINRVGLMGCPQSGHDSARDEIFFSHIGQSISFPAIVIPPSALYSITLRLLLLSLILFQPLAYASGRTNLKESVYNDLFCAKQHGGRRDVRHHYSLPSGEQKYVIVDCETDTHVWEGGLDYKRSSLDSVQQAIFFSTLTGKKPGVVIFDTDGKVGAYEHRISTVCHSLGVEYR